MSAPSLARCASCGAAPAAGSQACGVCKAVAYCGPGCQRTRRQNAAAAMADLMEPDHEHTCLVSATSSAILSTKTTALRVALTSRCGEDSPPGAWRAAAATIGIYSADAFLCHLCRSIAAALEGLSASAEAARIRLRELLRDLHNSHGDDLEASITAAESAKRAALECELCAADGVLERLRAERSTASAAAATLDDDEFAVKHAELAARLDAAEALLLTLPTTVIEPPHVLLVLDEHALLSGYPEFGRVVAPRAMRASDLTVNRVSHRTWAGTILTLRLVLQGDVCASMSTEELEVSLNAAAAATCVEAMLETIDAAPQHLHVDIGADVLGRYVAIAIPIPVSAPVGSAVCLTSLTLSGYSVAGLLRVELVEPPCPADLSSVHATQLQAWLPPGGSPSPGEWEEVYRATSHGFGADVFHERCDGRARLLVLIRAQEGGWLFGGFTAVGFHPPRRYYADPASFLFSLTNSLGGPEKLESKRTGMDLYYGPSACAIFGGCPANLIICAYADRKTDSYTTTGGAFAAPAAIGTHPMAQGTQTGWRAAEIVAWVV